MRPDEPDELNFRNRARLRRKEFGIKPEIWAIIATLVAVLGVGLFWLHSVGETVGEEESIRPIASEPEFIDALPAPRIEHQDNSQVATEVVMKRVQDARGWIYKCRAGTGATTYRSQACEEGESQLSRTPVMMSENTSALRAPSGYTTQPQSAVSTGQAAYIPRQDPRRVESHCEIAKAERKSARDRLGLSITYDGIQQLDEMVRQACK